jgi:hypothetical protein
MDTAILSATSALIGSLIGGLSTLAASWLTLRGRVRVQALVQEGEARGPLRRVHHRSVQTPCRCMGSSGREP